MSGLTREGFTASTYAEIAARIESRLTAFNSGFDFTLASPDGQLINIIGLIAEQLWNELGLVYHSYNPNLAVGAGLKNLGAITGIAYGNATRSSANVTLGGVAGTVVPANALVADANGNEFKTTLSAVIPANVEVYATNSGAIPTDVNTINVVKSIITGWDTVNNSAAGRVGGQAQTELQYRNIRNKTVLRNFTSMPEVILARLAEHLNISQARVFNNTSGSNLPDGTPPNTIHVTIGEVEGVVSDADIGAVILATKGLACPTFGSTTVSIQDTQGHPEDISFTRASSQEVYASIDVTFLSDDSAGAVEDMRNALVEYINALATGEDVIWSRLFGVLTPFAKAQINSLNIGTSAGTLNPANIVISDTAFAITSVGNINITVS